MEHDQLPEGLELPDISRLPEAQSSAAPQHSWLDKLLAEHHDVHEIPDHGEHAGDHPSAYSPHDGLQGLDMPMGMEDFAEALDQGVVRVHSADDINLALRHSNMDAVDLSLGPSALPGMDACEPDGPPDLHTNSLPNLHSSSMAEREAAASAITRVAAVTNMEPRRKMRRKADGRPVANVRKWLKVDSQGAVSMVQMDKYRIINKLGVQWRDLRIIDPHLATSYPSAILCRDKALVLNLEFIKAIVTTKYILILNPEDPNVLPFVDQLKQRIAAAQLQTAHGQGKDDSDKNSSIQANGSVPDGKGPGGTGPGSLRPNVPAWSNGRQDLPFELKVLELCLEQVLAYLEAHVVDLETKMRSALDTLTAKISAATLESVRRLKGRQKRLHTKVETIRGLLEQLLDDQVDMHKINLSAMERADAVQAVQAQRELSLRRVSLDRTSLKAFAAAAAAAAATSPAITSADLPPETPTIVYKDRDASSDTSSSNDSWSSEEEEEMQMVEQLLELYFMQLDNLLNRLQALKEYVDDTEDLINIQLDEHRNQIISINLLISMATVLMGAITAVSGIFGTNLNSQLESSYLTFILVCVISSAAAIVLWLAFCAVLWRFKLLNLGSSGK